MASNDSDLRSEVRQLTDYGTAILPQTDLKEVVSASKREVQGVANRSVTEWYTNRDAELALFWTACLFTKVKAGELDAAQMSLDQMESEALRAAGESGNDNPVIWYERAMSYSQRLVNEGGRFAIRSASRSGNRSYGSDDTGGSL